MSLFLADATVDLISRHQRPWLFRVTVKGKAPSREIRVYDVAATSDDSAAFKGLELFQKDMLHPLHILSSL